MTRYGDRDAVIPGSEVEAPDGRTFIQGDTSTYLHVDLDPVERPDDYQQDYGQRRPAETTSVASKVNGRVVTPEVKSGSFSDVRFVSRVRDGLYWVVTYEAEGETWERRILASTREGNG